MILITNAVTLVFIIYIAAKGLCHAKQDIEDLRRGCRLEGLHPLLIVTYKNIMVFADKITVPHGERVALRCRELGRYKLIGDSVLHCRNSVWNGTLPTCIPTTAISNYTGWAIAASERDWKYRLSIYYAKAQDSGIYTCSTPRGLTNSIRVRVLDVHCPSLPTLTPPLIGKIEGARMGQSATFECPEGHRLEGVSSMTCQYNGQWSAKVPQCVAILCPEVKPANVKLQLLEHNNSYGGRVVFACMWGHRLSGAQSIRCDGDGTWNGTMPTCSEITCAPPSAPRSGQIVEHERPSGKKRGRGHKVGALVRFACLPGHQLLGEASIICTENGTWSHQPPVCEVRCPYPGDPPHGRIAPLKFWYKPGDNIQVTCSPGYVTPFEPVKKPTCRENGIWSGPPPPCRSYRDV
ncbi:locomotion-related protein Hikaru genki isoform X4 [Cephus cinctus]|uniref:Locomotion-related protein Hikaru genki isoform X4 n=1 Tax=Cephus cinctus TaxID=211228 RepID=A0AAJ7RUY0_CEPCN|nr:locomotion-related protein Hikaru genki isoform X4 [Cephus cinctus]